MRLLLVTLLLVGPSAHAGKLWDLVCRTVNRHNSPTSWYDDLLRNKLRARYEKYLLERSHGPKPDLIEVGGARYSVSQRLGEGSEGDVFLVTTPQGASYVAKVFHNELLLDQNLTSLERRRAIGIRVPTIYSVSIKPPIVLMEYARGVPVQTLLSDPTLGAQERKRIKSEFDRQVLRIQPRDDLNTILDVETGEFILIDPT